MGPSREDLTELAGEIISFLSSALCFFFSFLFTSCSTTAKSLTSSESKTISL